jgi:hypothetical protein
LVVLVGTASTHFGFQRLVEAKTRLAGLVTGRTQPRPQDGDIRRLTAALGTLETDRDRLAARLAALEHNLSEITGSISRSAVATLPPVVAPTAAAVPEPPAAIAPQMVAPEPVRAEFGIDLGGGANVEAIRVLWAGAKVRLGALLDGMRPLVAIRDGTRIGTELRLVAGPLGNAAAAARLCSVIIATGALCQPALFDGQRLALR